MSSNLIMEMVTALLLDTRPILSVFCDYLALSSEPPLEVLSCPFYHRAQRGEVSCPKPSACDVNPAPAIPPPSLKDCNPDSLWGSVNTSGWPEGGAVAVDPGQVSRLSLRGGCGRTFRG